MSTTDDERHAMHLRSGCSRSWFHDGPCAPSVVWAGDPETIRSFDGNPSTPTPLPTWTPFSLPAYWRAIEGKRGHVVRGELVLTGDLDIDLAALKGWTIIGIDS